MEFKTCSKGHFYDPSVTSTCPQCAAEANATASPFDFGSTGPVNRVVEDFGATEPIAPMGETAPVSAPMPTSDSWSVQAVPTGTPMQEYGATMPIFPNNVAGFAPVVGWLVCIEGPAKGTDYRIRSGYNYIGRDDNMDICIRGDQHISGNRHAMVAYDEQEHLFFFGPADGKNIVRLNGKMVMMPMELHPYDKLTVGKTVLSFIPFCGENFTWDE